MRSIVLSTLPSVKQLPSQRLLTDQLADWKGWLPNKRFWPEEQVMLGIVIQQLVSLEKEMATHSSILAWKILWTEEPGGLYSPWGHKSQTQLSDKTNQANW